MTGEIINTIIGFSLFLLAIVSSVWAKKLWPDPEENNGDDNKKHIACVFFTIFAIFVLIIYGFHPEWGDLILKWGEFFRLIFLILDSKFCILLVMDEYTKEMLKKNLEVSQECLKILKKMNRARLASTFFRIVKWIVIIAISLGAYYYVEPYLQRSINALDSIMETTQQLQQTADALDPGSIQGNIDDSTGLLEQLQDLLGQ